MGGELGPLFAARHEPHLLWIVGLAAVALAACFALSALLRGRMSRELGLVGLAVAPLLALGLAGVDLANRSTEVRFCGSCHEPMAPVVASVLAPGESLASLHYQSGAVKASTACYACHSGYGIQGDFAAKLVGLRHMWRELWGTYRYPLALKKPFDIDACLECHAHTPKFRAVSFHTDPDTQALLVARQLSCTGACHPSAHPAESLNGPGGRP